MVAMVQTLFITTSFDDTSDGYDHHLDNDGDGRGLLMMAPLTAVMMMVQWKFPSDTCRHFSRRALGCLFRR